MDAFSLATLSIAVLLSSIVRLIRTDAAWKAVDENYAGAEHLRDLTGVIKRESLQDIFGPPTLEGIFNVSRPEVEKNRQITGHLMGNLKLDGLSVLIALLALIWKPYGSLGDVLNLFLMIAVLYQLAGWGATAMLMKDKA